MSDKPVRTKTKKPAVDLNGTRQLWTFDDLVSYLKMPRSTVFRYVALDKIPYIKLGRHRRFIPDEVEAVIRRLA